MDAYQPTESETEEFREILREMVSEGSGHGTLTIIPAYLPILGEFPQIELGKQELTKEGQITLPWLLP